MKKQSTSLPPGPSGSWLPTLRLMRNPRRAIGHWIERYGDPFFLNALNGPIVVTGRPELIREVFSHPSMNFGIFAEKNLKPMLGAGSMLMLSGEEHRRERKLMMPMFHGERMRAYASIMQQAAMEFMEQQAPGSPFSMLKVTTQISLKIIVQAIFGGEKAESIDTLVRLSQEAVRRTSAILFFSPKMHFSLLGLSPWDRYLKAQSALRTAFANELQRRRESPAEREDILTMLMQAKYEDGSGIDPEHLGDELGTFLFAGHETSAIAMAWAVYHLLCNPETLQKLRDEIAPLKAPNSGMPEASQLAQLPYLKAVVQETLRLNPIVTEVLRILKKPMQLDKYTLPAGTGIAVGIVMAHYNPEIYPEPDAFRPERFLENSYSSAEYLPFGGGARRCAGAAFATSEMAIVLGTIVGCFDLQLHEDKPVVPKRRNITIGPSTGIHVSVRSQA